MWHGGRQAGVSVLVCGITEHTGGSSLCPGVSLAIICFKDEQQEEKQGMFNKTYRFSAHLSEMVHIHTGL